VKNKMESAKLVEQRNHLQLTDSWSSEEARNAVKTDNLFMIRRAKLLFCQKYNISPSHLSSFMKGSNNKHISNSLQAFFMCTEEERYEALNFISPKALKQENPNLCYENGKMESLSKNFERNSK
jgi:hypothetical protein